MTDEEFLRALESATLPESEFGHTAHVRAAYLYLCGMDFPAALGRISLTIRRYATSLGRPERYHETITVACTALINQHLRLHGNAGGWSAFARANPALLDKTLLSRYFTPAQLAAEAARRVFVLPERGSSSDSHSGRPLKT